MAFPNDMTVSSFLNDSTSPLSKRRKFTPPTFHPIIPSNDNSAFENHTFSSPILPQLSSQAPTPEEIEASLLQVGMRVRKSVNDGYKQSPQKKFTPRPFANNLHRLSPETQKALLVGNTSPASEPEPFSAGGLHKVGNLAMQPLATATFCGINLSMMSWASEDYTSLNEQTLWSYTTSHKRNYEVDSDSDESQDWQPQTPTLTPEYGAALPMDYFNIHLDMDNMSDVSPFTQPNETVNHRGRKIAKPRSRARGQMHGFEEMAMPPTNAVNPFAALQMLPVQEQQPQQQEFGFGHKRVMSCGVEANIMDFGDAPFLQRREDVEMDCS